MSDYEKDMLLNSQKNQEEKEAYWASLIRDFSEAPTRTEKAVAAAVDLSLTESVPFPTPFRAAQIRQECYKLADFLVEKNTSYGSSIFEDVVLGGRTISALDAVDCRIADKIKRLTSGKEYDGDDTYQDLLGYLLIRSIIVKQSESK